MAGYWQITNEYNNKMVENYIYSTNWKPNGIKAGELTTLQQLCKFIYKSAKYLRSGSIKICHNNLKVVKRINRSKTKVSDFLLEGRAVIMRIRQIKKELNIEMSIEHIGGQHKI